MLKPLELSVAQKSILQPKMRPTISKRILQKHKNERWKKNEKFYFLYVHSNMKKNIQDSHIKHDFKPLLCYYTSAV